MHKANIFVAGFGIAIVVGVAALLVLGGDEQDISTDESVSTSQGATVVPSTAEVDRYVEYSASAIDEAEGQPILFFHAVWCSQCVQLERDIKRNGVPEGFTFIQVDFDENQELRQKYGVTIQTTLLKIDENGEEIDRYVPYNEPTLEAVKRDFL